MRVNREQKSIDSATKTTLHSPRIINKSPQNPRIQHHPSPRSSVIILPSWVGTVFFLVVTSLPVVAGAGEKLIKALIVGKGGGSSLLWEGKKDNTGGL
jgi:hypothetical protein